MFQTVDAWLCIAAFWMPRLVGLTQGHTATAVVLIVWSLVQTDLAKELRILGYRASAMLMGNMMIKNRMLGTLFSCPPYPSSLMLKSGSHIDIGQHSLTIQS